MVFSSYNSTSYLPLDNDQSVTFYKNENRLFPTAIVPPTAVALPASDRAADASNTSNISLGHMSNMSTTDMLTAAYEQQQQQHHHHRQLIVGSGSGSIGTGDCPFGRVQSPAAAAAATQQHLRQQLPQQPAAAQHRHHRLGGAVAMCDDFQPVAYLNGSSNGYYGYVPSLASVAPAAGGHLGHLQHTLNNNNNNHIGLEGAGGNRSLEPAAAISSAGATPNVNGSLSSAHYHGNVLLPPQHPIGGTDNERRNNNNNNNSNNSNVDPFDRKEPFSPGLLHQRKRKEMVDFAASLDQQGDEDMDTNAQLAFDRHPKRRKAEPEMMLQGTALPVPASLLFAGDSAVEGDPYLQQQQAIVAMECQEAALHQHPDHASLAQPSTEEYANGFHHPHTPGSQPGAPCSIPVTVDVHHPASKSKYFDSNRCMMSHMI